jgi:hypothetical protein
MAGRRYTPKWIANAPNYLYWKVRDPMGKNYDVTARARDIISKKVEELLAQKY